MAKVETKHPQYAERFNEWSLMRHADRGQSSVHEEGVRYLPMPSGFKEHEQRDNLYSAYLARARFPDIIAPILRGMVGLIHRTEAQIEMPKALEPLWEKATSDKLPLEAFHRRVTSEILLMGRYGILTDVPDESTSKLPYFAGYQTEGIINWDGAGNFFVLDETGLRRDGFEWKEQKKFRELTLDGDRYVQRVYDGNDLNTSRLIVPQRRGGGAMETIPLVVASPRDLSMTLFEPPLIGIARASLAMYQLDADYRYQLFMSGQETLVITGSDEDLPKAIGAGVVIGLPMGADAKYVGPSGRTIEAHRVAINDAREDAINAGAAMFQPGADQESGEAKRLRYASQTASLTTVSQTSAQALEAALRHAAIFLGLDPTDVVVKPNLRFVDTVMSPADAKALMEVWMGGGMSKLSLFENLQRGEIVSAERSFEEEEALIEIEPVDEPTAGQF